MDRHIFPLGDSQPHSQSEWCPCKPTPFEDNGAQGYFHHFFDGREIVLEAEIIMGMRCEGCGHYINEKGEHCDPPPPYDEMTGKVG